MAGALELLCLRSLPLTRTQHTPASAVAGTPSLPRASQLSLRRPNRGLVPNNARAVRVFAKGNKVRQKQKSANSPTRSPEKRIASPPVPDSVPISAPAVLELLPKDANPVVDAKTVAELDELISGTSTTAPPDILSWDLFPRVGRQILRQLSSFKLAIAELAVIAFLSAVGTIIEQNESPQFYFENYSEEKPILGFLTWRVIFGASLDHIYSSWYYLGLLLLLAASLIACSTTRQFPMVKVARRWSFMKSATLFKKLPISETLQRAKLVDFATLLMSHGYEVFARDSALYGFKGLAGRYAPIGVHVALLLIMGGATVSAIGGYHGTVMIPQGLGYQLGDVLAPKGVLSMPAPVMNLQVHVNKFSIDYRTNGAVSQFHSDLSLVDLRDKEVYKKTISVNDPLRYGGLTMYQTDWAISAVQVRVDGSDPYNLVMATLESGDKKLFGTFLPLGQEGLEKAKGISILARDLQSVVIYDQEGNFVGIRRPGSDKPISVDGVSIVVDDIIGSSGLELKMDPGVPIVYAGFGALMLTTIVSYFSHSQVWAVQDGNSLVVGGKTNRGKVEFNLELNRILDLVPEISVISRPETLLADSHSSGNGVVSAPAEAEICEEEIQSR